MTGRRSLWHRLLGWWRTEMFDLRGIADLADPRYSRDGGGNE